MSRLRTSTAAVALAMMSVLAAGCSSEDGDTAATPEASATPEPGEIIAAYFEGLGDEDADAMAAAASPGSPAADYADYWADMIELDQLSSRTVTTSDTEAQVTKSGGLTADNAEGGDTVIEGETQAPDADDTAVFADFTFDDNGLMETWTETPGGPLQPRIVATPKKVKVGQVKLAIRNQYQWPDGTLWITAKASNSAKQTVQLVEEDYITPKGKQLGGTIGDYDSTGVVTVRGKASTMLYFQIDKADTVGGTLFVYTFPDGGGTTIAEATIKLPKK